MIIEYIRYEVPRGQEAAFLDAYRAAGAELRASPHCLRYEVAQCTEEPTTFVVRITWDSAAGHLEGFRREPTFPSFFAKVKPYFEAIREMRHYALTDVVFDRA